MSESKEREALRHLLFGGGDWLDNLETVLASLDKLARVEALLDEWVTQDVERVTGLKAVHRALVRRKVELREALTGSKKGADNASG